ARPARSNQGSSRPSWRGSKEQGIGLRVYHVYSSTDAAWDCRITDRSDSVRHDVSDGSSSECSGYDHSRRFLSAVDSPECERPSLRSRGPGADGGGGFDCYGGRFIGEFGGEPY